MIKDRLTTAQVTVQLYAAMVGVGVLSLPHTVSRNAGVDGWIAILIAGLYSMIAVSLMAYIGSRFPGKSLIQYAPLLLGRPLGILILIGFIVYFLLFVGTVVRISADVTKLFLLDLTPVEIVVISMLVTSTYLIQHGINAIARFNELIQPATLLLLLFVLTQTLRETEFGRLLPVLGDGITPVLYALPSIFFAFLGYETLLFIQPFMEKPDKAKPASLIAIGSTMLLYLLLTVLSTATLGSSETALVKYPTLAIIKSIEVPGSFIERLDSVMMMVWIPFAITTIVMFQYCASLITSQLLRLKEHRVITLLYVPVVYLIAVLPRNVLEVDRLGNWVSLLGGVLVSLVPLLLVLSYQWKKRRLSR